MRIVLSRAAVAALGAAVLGLTTTAAEAIFFRPSQQFERVATFLVCENTSCDRNEVELTAAEIVAASDDGRTLVYTWIQEKVEGVGLAADGDVYIVTDNDGVDENTGETQFIRLGNRARLGF